MNLIIVYGIIPYVIVLRVSMKLLVLRDNIIQQLARLDHVINLLSDNLTTVNHCCYFTIIINMLLISKPKTYNQKMCKTFPNSVGGLKAFHIYKQELVYNDSILNYKTHTRFNKTKSTITLYVHYNSSITSSGGFIKGGFVYAPFIPSIIMSPPI
jgi:hypothetical protein